MYKIYFGIPFAEKSKVISSVQNLNYDFYYS